MPAIYAHLRFGEEVAKTLPVPFTELIERFPEAFHLGTQGPDILFYHHPMKKNGIRKRGGYLHTFSGEKFFAEQSEKLISADTKTLTELFDKNGALAAYLVGFLCHFTLDTLCHPYIDGHSTEKVSHGKIESELDKAILRKDGKPVRGYNTATPILNKNGAAESAATTLNIPKESIELAIKTMRKINGWFSNKCELFHAFAHFFLKIVGMDRRFGDMFLHKKDDPLCESTNHVLIEKFNDGILKASKLIEEYFESLLSTTNERVNNELFRYNFSGIITKEETVS